MQAVKNFVDDYNALYSNNKLKKVNVGSEFNDLRNQVADKHKVDEILTGINFGKYGVSGQTYQGDWATSQFNLWSLEEYENGKQK